MNFLSLLQSFVVKQDTQKGFVIHKEFLGTQQVCAKQHILI